MMKEKRFIIPESAMERICTECGKKMDKYSSDNGGEYYKCSCGEVVQ